MAGPGPRYRFKRFYKKKPYEIHIFQRSPGLLCGKWIHEVEDGECVQRNEYQVIAGRDPGGLGGGLLWNGPVRINTRRCVGGAGSWEGCQEMPLMFLIREFGSPSAVFWEKELEGQQGWWQEWGLWGHVYRTSHIAFEVFLRNSDGDVRASLVAQRWRICLPLQEMQETWVQSLGWEDPLEKEMAPHSSILAWRIPWTEEPGGLQSVGSQKSQTRLSD